MIITPDRLIDLAKEETEQRAKRLPITAGYLVGSVLQDEPLLGGTADIDLILIHKTFPLRPREVKRLSPDVHLDIYNLSKEDFENPRDLRTEPLLGSSLCGSMRLYDPDHFFDWAQAAACAQFSRPDNRLARAHKLLEDARVARKNLTAGEPTWPRTFVHAAWNGANALCCLHSKPVHGRRAVPHLRQRLEALNALEHLARFLALFDAQGMEGWNIPHWLTSFGKAFDFAIQLNQGETAKPVRRDYFLRAFQELAESGQPEAVVVSLLTHWPLPATAEDPIVQEAAEANAWRDLLNATGLSDGEFKRKRSELEVFLDGAELFMEDWGAQHGA